jgi:general stress protein 26
MDHELDEMARRVIDDNRYLVLGTLDPDGLPRLSPVYYVAARHRDLYWVSSPDSHHSANLASRPEVRITIFDSTAEVGKGQAVYLAARARQVPDDELMDRIGEAFDPSRGARAFGREELTGDGDVRLYVAETTACEVHVPGGHPTLGTGIDRRVVAHPEAQVG